MAGSGGEQIFVVRRDGFFGGRWPQGFVTLGRDAGEDLVREIEARAFLVDRDLAETNPDWQQPIPYCLLTSGSRTFCVRRRTRSTEQRLHGLYSVGIGGHVGPVDRAAAAPGKLMQACLERELREELVLPRGPLPRARLAGLVKDDSNPVGKVHAGLVYRLELTPSIAAKVAVREISKLHGAFTPLVELQKLWQDPRRFETWSQLVLRALVLPPEEPGEIG
jgi:predicted NUDIX family phosphoesterase